MEIKSDSTAKYSPFPPDRLSDSGNVGAPKSGVDTVDSRAKWKEWCGRLMEYPIMQLFIFLLRKKSKYISGSGVSTFGYRKERKFRK